MKKHLALLLLALPLALLARQDQIWLEYVLEGKPFAPHHFLDASGITFLDHSPITELEFMFEQDLEFNDHWLYISETMPEIGYRLAPWFKFMVGHRLMREHVARDGFATEHRPTLDLHFYAPEFLTLRLDWRCRFEYRDWEHRQPYMRYRERIRVKTSWSITDFRISPYISEEALFEDKPKGDDADLFDQNRATIGVSFTPIPSHPDFSCALYLLVMHEMRDHSSTWDPVNVFGLEMAYEF